MYLKGERWEDEVQRILARAPQLSMSRAKLSARTETSKANAAVTEMRAREIGSNWYFWRSSHDERVRHSHDFNPLTPRGVRPATCFAFAVLELFQSTHPAGGETGKVEFCGLIVVISIHSPRGG